MKRQTLKTALTIITAIALTLYHPAGLMPTGLLPLGLSAAAGDVPSEWAGEEVLKAWAYGLVPADMYHSFTADITRREFCRLVMALYAKLTNGADEAYEADESNESDEAGEAEKPSYMPAFTDTDDISVLNAYRLGIVKGVGEGRFAPEIPVARQEIAVMLYNTINAIAVSIGRSILNASAVGLTFEDRGQTDEWAVEAIRSLRNNDIMIGDDRNRFNPRDNTTKEMAFILINRSYLIYAGLDAKKAFPAAYSGEIIMRVKGSFMNGAEYQIVGDVYEPYPDVTIDELAGYLEGEAFVDGDGQAYYINRSDSLAESVKAGYAGGRFYPVYALLGEGAPQGRLYIIGDETHYRIYKDAGRQEPYFLKTFSDVLFIVPGETPIHIDGTVYGIDTELRDLYLWRVQLTRGRVTRLTALLF